jgi:hypothetical protein
MSNNNTNLNDAAKALVSGVALLESGLADAKERARALDESLKRLDRDMHSWSAHQERMTRLLRAAGSRGLA